MISSSAAPPGPTHRASPAAQLAPQPIGEHRCGAHAKTGEDQQQVPARERAPACLLAVIVACHHHYWGQYSLLTYKIAVELQGAFMKQKKKSHSTPKSHSMPESMNLWKQPRSLEATWQGGG